MKVRQCSSEGQRQRIRGAGPSAGPGAIRSRSPALAQATTPSVEVKVRAYPIISRLSSHTKMKAADPSSGNQRLFCRRTLVARMMQRGSPNDATRLASMTRRSINREIRIACMSSIRIAAAWSTIAAKRTGKWEFAMLSAIVRRLPGQKPYRGMRTISDFCPMGG
jgi:hypothetical protein